MNIHLIVLGKLKEPFWREAEAEYLKRLTPLAKLHIHELKEESFDEKDLPELIKAKEAEKITQEIAKIKNGYVVALDERGAEFSSLSLANHLSALQLLGAPLVFVMGGPLGLHPSITKLARGTIALSKLTFTHQMARVIFLEQLYRAQMILGNRKYHY